MGPRMETEMIEIKVTDMTCGHCASTITRAVQALEVGQGELVGKAEGLSEGMERFPRIGLSADHSTAWLEYVPEGNREGRVGLETRNDHPVGSVRIGDAVAQMVERMPQPA